MSITLTEWLQQFITNHALLVPYFISHVQIILAVNAIWKVCSEMLSKNTLFDKQTYSEKLYALPRMYLADANWLCMNVKQGKRLEELCNTWEYSWRFPCINQLKCFVPNSVHSVQKCCCVSFSFYNWLRCFAVGSHVFLLSGGLHSQAVPADSVLCQSGCLFNVILYCQVICHSVLSFLGAQSTAFCFVLFPPCSNEC